MAENPAGKGELRLWSGTDWVGPPAAGMKGAYLWGVKDWIDRGFMRKYSSDLDFSAMSAHVAAGSQRGPAHGQLGPEAVAVAAAAKMRCGGCGSKVGASTLGRVLRRLQRDEEEAGAAAGGGGLSGGGAVLVGLGSADDAAVLQAPPPGHVLVHSIDFFRALVDDPFLFGRIAANHALGDIHAMGRAWLASPSRFPLSWTASLPLGTDSLPRALAPPAGAQPASAMAVAVVPFASGAVMEGDLYQMMAGAATALREAGCALVGGHSCEGAELALGEAPRRCWESWQALVLHAAPAFEL